MEALLEEVSRHLSGRGVRHALIGAGALAVHGVSRSTFDLDLLVTDQAVLQAAFWAELAAAGPSPLGDPTPPAAGHGPAWWGATPGRGSSCRGPGA
ncbi:MAG: hypothetical protein IPQ24_20605 [Anaeromyxobacter sp.]|nr:hypothetical protein [Anaeromyxobacter sp.]